MPRAIFGEKKQDILAALPAMREAASLGLLGGKNGADGRPTCRLAERTALLRRNAAPGPRVSLPRHTAGSLRCVRILQPRQIDGLEAPMDDQFGDTAAGGGRVDHAVPEKPATVSRLGSRLFQRPITGLPSSSFCS